MKTHWPSTYLNRFSAFVDDTRSSDHIGALINYHLGNGFLVGVDNVQVVDLCCGTGHAGRIVSEHLSPERSVQVTYVDQTRSETFDTDTRFIQSDVSIMNSIADSSFDVAVSRYGFNNLPQEKWLPALSETLRILKPGGMFLLQDHFVPGAAFSALVNEAERFLARMEKKESEPFIFSTEAFNLILDENQMVASRVKAGYGFWVDIWERLKSKSEILGDFDFAKQEILRFYREVCLEKYGVLIVNPDEYIHVYNITYAIVKRS